MAGSPIPSFTYADSGPVQSGGTIGPVTFGGLNVPAWPFESGGPGGKLFDSPAAFGDELVRGAIMAVMVGVVVGKIMRRK